MTVIDDIDADLAAYKWFASVSHSGGPYASRNSTGHPKHHIRLHRVILERMLGRPLTKGECVDHIDGNPVNNQRSNLRLATTAQNICNSKRRSDNASGFKGVTFDKGVNKWQAQIRVEKRQVHLGYFDTPEEAYQAYCQASKKYHGEFGRLN